MAGPRPKYKRGKRSLTRPRGDTMTRALSPAVILAERLCRPQRVGVFGHRGVGKTTLLTLLYREAVGGRLPELRLAAADARTADYLSDKIVPLETGQALDRKSVV